MKSILALLTLVLAITITSCKKEDVKPVQPQNTSNTFVERDVVITYHIYAVSGGMKFSYTELKNGQPITTTGSINRMDNTVSINAKSGKTYSVSATNVSPSSQEVYVEILIDGVVKASGQTTVAGTFATAKLTVL